VITLIAKTNGYRFLKMNHKSMKITSEKKNLKIVEKNWKYKKTCNYLCICRREICIQVYTRGIDASDSFLTTFWLFHLRQMIYLSRADDISSVVDDYQLCCMIFIFSRRYSTEADDIHLTGMIFLESRRYSSDGNDSHSRETNIMYDGWFLKLQSTTGDDIQPPGS
jgi:hypothetical protein